MNKHFFGLIVFSMIVGTSVIIAGMFVKLPPIPTISPVSDSDSIFKTRGERYCKHKKKKPQPKNISETASVQIVKSVFSEKLDLLNTQFLVERSDERTEKFELALHFFVDDGFSIQHVATEFVSVRPNFDIGETGSAVSTSDFRWLKNLESRKNLFVSAEIHNYSSEKFSDPVFNRASVKPVLIEQAR